VRHPGDDYAAERRQDRGVERHPDRLHVRGRRRTEVTLSAILVEGLVVHFGPVEAVRGVSFAVEPGKSFGLLGPNGAGKTTTIRVLTTLLRPTAGRALVAGHDVVRGGLAIRQILGYIPQAISIDGALTARENLEFYARVTDVPRRERRERIEHATAVMGIESFIDRLGRNLSGGMLRRLEIATALLNRPQILFLDEPTVGLDPTARRNVWERLEELRAEAGTTLLVTTHQMEEAERQCDRIAIMDEGVLVAQGTPAELNDQFAVDTLDEVFTAATGRSIAEGGTFRDARRSRRLSRRLG
jgi:ABC-2 type transport system ATP-binding protein